MNTDTDLKWIDEDYTRFEKYNFSKGTITDIKAFFEAKKSFIQSENEDTRYAMKNCFLSAHSRLKIEKAHGKISPNAFDELTELLKKGV